MKEDQKRWDQKYKEVEFHPEDKQPNPLLKRYIRLFPRGKALDVATGQGKNAVFLAEHGFNVEAIDISRVGLRRAKELAKARGVKIKTVVADLDSYSIPQDHYDLILDFYFLDRRLIPRIKKGIKKGGMVFFETYTTEQKSLGWGRLTNPKYLLKPNELLDLFRNFRILFYREGTFRQAGKRRAIATLIAQKN